MCGKVMETGNPLITDSKALQLQVDSPYNGRKLNLKLTIDIRDDEDEQMNKKLNALVKKMELLDSGMVDPVKAIEKMDEVLSFLDKNPEVELEKHGAKYPLKDALPAMCEGCFREAVKLLYSYGNFENGRNLNAINYHEELNKKMAAKLNEIMEPLKEAVIKDKPKKRRTKKNEGLDF